MLGFPDGWVAIDDLARTAKLRMLGNSVQVQIGAIAAELMLTQEAA